MFDKPVNRCNGSALQTGRVGMAPVYGLTAGGSEFESWCGRFLSSPRRPDTFCGQLKLLSNGLPCVKRPGREADRSLTSAASKNTWICTSSPPYAFGVCYP
jgi:hypothetical protein